MNALLTAAAARRGSAALALVLAIGAFGLATTATASVATSAAPRVFIVDTVDGTTDADRCSSGSDCSLGDAIEEANALPGKDTIAFAIPGDGPHLIVIPSGPTPAAVTDAVVIDGETQPGSSQRSAGRDRDRLSAHDPGSCQ